MQVPPVLEDQSYPGRSGGYVARITGKLLHEAATSGSHRLFFPAPRLATTHYVYAGLDATCPPLVQVPHEFYLGLYERIKAGHGIGQGSKSSESVVTYGGNAYIFRVNLVTEPVRGVAIAISAGGT